MNKSLSVNEVALLSMIKSLSKNKGYCYASNKAFSDTLNVSVRTINRMFNKLEQSGYLMRDTRSVGQMGKQRKVKLTESALLVDYTI